MDAKELTLLENKTRAIVDSLLSLQSETERQQEIGDGLEQSKDALLKLASELSNNAEQLADVLELIRHSTLADDISRLEAKTDEIVGADERIGRVESVCGELLQRIEALEAIIGRIDRNTQKGFGKERG